MTSSKIGTGYVPAEFEYLDRRFECAAWSRTTKVHTQTFDIFACWNGYGRLSFHVVLESTIVEDDFQSYFGGNACGRSYDRKQNAGKARELRLGLGDDYQFAKILHAGEAHLAFVQRARVEIDPSIYVDPVTMHPFQVKDGEGPWRYLMKLGKGTEEAIHQELHKAAGYAPKK